MWILTNFGAFMPALRPPETVAPGDDQVMQIRARRRVDLERLRKEYMPELGPTYWVENSDYQYRANCTRTALARAVADIAMSIDYVTFKETARDDQLHDAYMSVWAALLHGLSTRRGRQSVWSGRLGQHARRGARR